MAKLPTNQQLCQSWHRVRNLLIESCGIKPASKTIDVQHCFADGTHLECCAPARKRSYANTNADGKAPGISRHNLLPLHDSNGRWCTCLSGHVCQNQFNTPPDWTAVWVGSRLFIAVSGKPVRMGEPTGTLPSTHARRISLAAYEELHPAFLQRAKEYVKRAPSSSIGRSAPKRTTTKSRTSKKKIIRCVDIGDDLKRGSNHDEHMDLVCISPSGKLMRYPRRYSYNECKTFRKRATKGFTIKSSCAAYFH